MVPGPGPDRGLSDTDLHWRRWGATDPYFAVLVDPVFRRARQDPAVWRQFMDTGEEYTRETFTRLRAAIDDPPRPSRALDFGCGVGRVLVPLAARCEEVVGVDVSHAMLTEARENLDRLQVTNVTLLPSDDDLSRVEGTFDLVHTVQVLQHIPVDRGLQILGQLLSRLRPGGLFAVQVPYRCDSRRARRRRLLAGRPRLTALANIARGRPRDTPLMQMYGYPLDRLLAAFHAHGIGDLLVHSYDLGWLAGVQLTGRRPTA